MKKIFTVIFVALLATIPLVGCGSTSTPNNNSANDNKWVEIQSVTYYTNNGSGTSTYPSAGYTVTSSVKVEVTTPEKITQEEYDNTSKDQKAPSIIFNNMYSGYGNLSGGNFSVDRKSDIQTLQNSINNTYNYQSYNYGYYEYSKATVKSYQIHYVKIRFLDNNTFELNYYIGTGNIEYKTIRVKPLSYIVTYFNN